MAQMGSQCICPRQSFRVPHLSSTQSALNSHLEIGHVNLSLCCVKHTNPRVLKQQHWRCQKRLSGLGAMLMWCASMLTARFAWTRALADFCGAGQKVAEWAKAMTGSAPFEEALAAQLSLFKPSLGQVEHCMEKRPLRISPGIAEPVKMLKAKNVDVYLVSGGFRQMIKPIAMQLCIPPENIFANQLLFGTSGEYVGFDPAEPTSRSGGKAVAVQHIRQKCGYKTLIMIGNGAIDLEAWQPNGADLFICYAGVQMREAVASKADWLIFDFGELMGYLVYFFFPRIPPVLILSVDE